MRRLDVDGVARLIADAAAEEVKPRFGKLDAGEIRAKSGPTDLVTVADLAMEKRLTAGLPSFWPGSVVVGEEAVEADPTVQDRLDQAAAVWIIDPVDGTHNFAHGIPKVAVLVALVLEGETVAGWLHDPLTGSIATVERGGGAWRDGVRQRVAEPGGDRLPRGSIHAAGYPAEIRARFDRADAGIEITPYLFCSGHDYLELAGGVTDFGFFWGLKPWDHAAGVLLHAEAGGYARALDGSPYRATRRAPGLLLANDEGVWRTLHDRFIAGIAS